MAVTVKYNGDIIASAAADITKTLKTAGKYCEADIIVENTADGGITPSGTINLTDTALTDVTNYANAQVVDADLVAGNIKKDVNILGVVGTFEGGGGGGNAYTEHTINFTLASSTGTFRVLRQYVSECADWLIYPADSDNTEINTFAYGQWYRDNSPVISWNGNGRYQNIVTPTGITVPNFYFDYYVNDVSYNSVRVRGNIGEKPAGNYVLKFYGIAK